MQSSIHALAQRRAECASKLDILGRKPASEDAEVRASEQSEYASAVSDYQAAEDAYQRAISMMTNSELIAEGLAP